MSETVYIGVHAYEEFTGQGYEEFVESLDCETYFLRSGGSFGGRVPEAFDDDRSYVDVNGRATFPGAMRERMSDADRLVFSGYRADKCVPHSIRTSGMYDKELLVDSDHTYKILEDELVSVSELMEAEKDDRSMLNFLYCTGVGIVSSEEIDF